MAERFITLMAVLDEHSQKIMSSMYEKLTSRGFQGTQTPGLPYHISLGSFPLEKELIVSKEMLVLAKEFQPITIDMNGVEVFDGGNVLFVIPEMSDALLKLKNAIKIETNDMYPWQPHVTILIDESEKINEARSIINSLFKPFKATITGLHLCAFWPTREIAFTEFKKR